jgi:hypothetical protein
LEDEEGQERNVEDVSRFIWPSEDSNVQHEREDDRHYDSKEHQEANIGFGAHIGAAKCEK